MDSTEPTCRAQDLSVAVLLETQTGLGHMLTQCAAAVSGSA